MPSQPLRTRLQNNEAISYRQQVTCDEGLEPACPLLDLLSFPSLFFLPLDTEADSLSPRGAFSAGTKRQMQTFRKYLQPSLRGLTL